MSSDELFPGFKTPPNDPSRDLRRPALTIAKAPPITQQDLNDDYWDEDSEPCKNCDGWGYTDCFCGGDLCVCRYNGEKPCWNCV